MFRCPGVVNLGGSPMPMGGTVEFHPDTGKGNNYKGKPSGMIKPDGTYTLNTLDGREGVPAGWYKATVTGQGMPDPSKMAEAGKMPTPPVVNAKYTKPETTIFSIEVKEGAPRGGLRFVLGKVTLVPFGRFPFVLISSSFATSGGRLL